MPDTPPPVGRIAYIALTVTDVRRSSKWYQRVLGLTLERENIGGSAWPSDIDEVLLRSPSGLAIGLLQHPDVAGPFDERRAGLDHVEFEVDTADDLMAWERHLTLHDVAHSGVKNGRILTFRDPDNIQLEFFLASE